MWRIGLQETKEHPSLPAAETVRRPAPPPKRQSHLATSAGRTSEEGPEGTAGFEPPGSERLRLQSEKRSMS